MPGPSVREAPQPVAATASWDETHRRGRALVLGSCGLTTSRRMTLASSDCSSARNPAEPAVTRAEVGDGLTQVSRGEVGPEARSEVQLRVCAFPEEEVAQPPLSSGAD